MRGTATRPDLVGNRYVLGGAALYLLEWVAIIAIGVAGVGAVVGRDLTEQDLSRAYAGNADVIAFMSGWFAVVLLGRVLVFIGLRRSLVESGRPHLLMDFAVVAAAASVLLETASYGLVLAAAGLEADHPAGMVALHEAALALNLLLGGGLGVAILCASHAMTRSGLFPVTLLVLGWVAGAGAVASQLTIGPGLSTVSNALQFSTLLFWLWMLWLGVLLWRHAPRKSMAAPA